MKKLKLVVLILVASILGCSTNYQKNFMTSSVDYGNIDSIYMLEAQKYYDNKIMGRIIIWTDKDFLDSSTMSINELKSNRDMRIVNNEGTRISNIVFSKSVKYVIYGYSGKYVLETSRGSKYSKTKEVQIEAGEQKTLFWKNPESELIENSKYPNDLNTIALSYTSKAELKEKYVPQINVECIVAKNEKTVQFRIEIKDKNEIKEFKLNGVNESFKKNERFSILKDLQYGENVFTFLVKNDKGIDEFTSFRYTRLTEQEKNKIAEDELREKKRLAELKKQEIADAKAKKAELERIAREGDGSNEDKLCQRYGLKPQTNGYAECRMRLDFAKADSIKQQQQYEREQAAYQEQMAAIQKERERQRAMKQLELGLRMMGGQSPVDAVNSVGTGAPIAPRAPSPTNQTITLPNGRMVNCTTMGTMTNCF